MPQDQIAGQYVGMRYRPDIDGLRAVAVLAVVLYHAYPAYVTGGFIGVDVFFVISGFLISGIIIDGMNRGKFSLADFYGRRIRRIFPALTVVLVFCIAAGAMFLFPFELAQLGKHFAARAAFISNFVLWSESGYFDVGAKFKPLLHLWSLGIEEQFYIFWPMLVLLLYSRRSWPAILAAFFIVSFLANLILMSRDAVAAFYLPISRFWELMLGAALAWSMRTHNAFYAHMPSGGRFAAARDAAAAAGLAMITASAALLTTASAFPGWLALAPTAGAALVIAAGPEAWVNRLVLSHPAAIFVGLISYPLYLWHWPLLSISTIIRLGHPPPPLIAGIIIAASVVLAWLTYRFVEKPIRFGAQRGRKTFAMAATMTALGLIGVYALLRPPLLWHQRDLAEFTAAGIYAAGAEHIFRPTKSMTVVVKEHDFIVGKIGNGSDKAMFIGDSLIFHYAPRVEELFATGRLTKTVYFVVGASCAPLPGVVKVGVNNNCVQMIGTARDIIARDNVGKIVLGASWSGYFVKPMVIERSGQRTPGADPAAFDSLFSNLEDYIRELVAAKRQVYVVLSSPIHPKFDPRQMISRSLTGFKVAPDAFQNVPFNDPPALTKKIDHRLKRITANTGAVTLDPFPDICGSQITCSPIFDSGVPKFADNMHLRPIFVRQHIRMFDDILLR